MWLDLHEHAGQRRGKVQSAMPNHRSLHAGRRRAPRRRYISMVLALVLIPRATCEPCPPEACGPNSIASSLMAAWVVHGGGGCSSNRTAKPTISTFAAPPPSPSQRPHSAHCPTLPPACHACSPAHRYQPTAHPISPRAPPSPPPVHHAPPPPHRRQPAPGGWADNSY